MIAAGGDGTIGRAARCLIGHAVPIAVLPLGTANNIAKGLGVFGDVRAIVRGLADVRTIPVDIGFAKGPWGQRPFIEGAGFGLFPDAMAALQKRKSKPKKDTAPLEHALRAMRGAADDFDPKRLELAIDGEDFSGRYLMVEAMNLNFVGPNLSLADDADPGDGLLDIVLVGEDERRLLADHLDGRLAGVRNPPRLGMRRGRRIHLVARGNKLHVDDEIWPRDKKKKIAAESGVVIELGIERHALPFLARTFPRNRSPANRADA